MKYLYVVPSNPNNIYSKEEMDQHQLELFIKASKLLEEDCALLNDYNHEDCIHMYNGCSSLVEVVLKNWDYFDPRAKMADVAVFDADYEKDVHLWTSYYAFSKELKTKILIL